MAEIPGAKEAATSQQINLLSLLLLRDTAGYVRWITHSAEAYETIDRPLSPNAMPRKDVMVAHSMQHSSVEAKFAPSTIASIKLQRAICLLQMIFKGDSFTAIQMQLDAIAEANGTIRNNLKIGTDSSRAVAILDGEITRLLKEVELKENAAGQTLAGIRELEVENKRLGEINDEQRRKLLEASKSAEASNILISELKRDNADLMKALENSRKNCERLEKDYQLVRGDAVEMKKERDKLAGESGARDRNVIEANARCAALEKENQTLRAHLRSAIDLNENLQQEAMKSNKAYGSADEQSRKMEEAVRRLQAEALKRQDELKTALQEIEYLKAEKFSVQKELQSQVSRSSDEPMVVKKLEAKLRDIYHYWRSGHADVPRLVENLVAEAVAHANAMIHRCNLMLLEEQMRDQRGVQSVQISVPAADGTYHVVSVDVIVDKVKPKPNEGGKSDVRQPSERVA